jgi:light-regulated signal transduction histidine kinase (bacteriophytochrome)
VNTGNPYEIEYRFKDRVNGDYRWFLGRALPVRNAEGQIVKWFGTCTDIHEGKTISEKLEILVRERTEELERSNDDLQQFAHVASHDLKEPLRKIRVFANLMQEEFAATLPDKAITYLNKMQSAAVRMSSMVDGVLNYSITNTSEQQFESVNLNDIMEEIKQDLEVIIQQKEADFFYDKLPHIKGIRVLIYQLFYNLINNALKFSKENEKNHITITSKENNKSKLPANFSLQSATHYISIEVNDTGIGFDEAYTEKMFQIFSRLNAKDKYEGTGLGLALCRKIVSRHHGAISAKGRLHEGASFTIVLPSN